MKNKFNLLINILIIITIALSIHSCENEDLDSTFDQIILSNQDKALIKNANNFGFDLLKLSETSKYNQNISISPFELSSDLNLLLNGTSGFTFYYINTLINPSNLTVDEINNSYKRIYEAINNLSGYNINLLNGFWFNNNMGVNDQFKNIGNYFYKTRIDSINCALTSEINNIDYWLRYETADMLELNDPGINGQTQSFLINGFNCNLDFKYFFQNSFNGPFYLSENDTVSVKMLKLNQSLKYYKNDSFSLIEIPYANNSFSLLVLLPNNGYSISEIINTINSESWESWIKNLIKTNISLTLPEINQLVSVNVTSFITNSSFYFLVDESDEFTGITDKPYFKINYILSQSRFKISDNRLHYNKSNNNENIEQIDEFIDFIVNKPFLYALKENSSNLVLSAGIIYNPSN